MQLQPYSIALIARGTAAYAFSYAGPPGLARGQLVLVTFRHVLEPGLVLHSDSSPPEGVELLPLIPVLLEGPPARARLGAVLADLAELACCGPDEIAGHLLLDAPSRALRLSLELLNAPLITAALGEAGLTVLSLLAGVLTPAKRKALLKAAPFAKLAELATAGALRFTLALSGTPEATRRHSAWAQRYELDALYAASLGLPPEAVTLPGAYLAGLAEAPDLKKLPKAGRGSKVGGRSRPKDAGTKTPDAEKSEDESHTTVTNTAPSTIDHRPSTLDSELRTQNLPWIAVACDPRWDVLQRWPQLAQLALEHCQASWAELKGGALLAELSTGINAGQRLLLITPQAWMLDRLWPTLAALPQAPLRFRAESGPLTAGQLLREHAAALEAGRGLLIAGNAGAWKLAAFAPFERIILLDPTHPQYEPHGSPWLDPRVAMLLAAATQGGGDAAASAPRCTVQLIELGLSVFGMAHSGLRIASAEPEKARPETDADSDPDAPVPPVLPGKAPAGKVHEDGPEVIVPLELLAGSEPRLVYINRLGAGRGLSCAECHAPVPCPRCGSRGIYFSPARKAYVCPSCELVERDLRCPRCGLMTLAAATPGLESITPGPGDVLVRAVAEGEAQAGERQLAAARVLYGTARLLEPSLPYITREVIYVHAESQLGVLADWPRAVDMALRLQALYGAAENPAPVIVSARLREQLGAELSAAELSAQWQAELRLRRLAGLPPYGTAYHLRARGVALPALKAARELVGQRLAADSATSLLRLGGVYSEGLAGPRRVQRFGAWLLNASIGQAQLQALRWELQRMQVSLDFQPLRGPWL